MSELPVSMATIIPGEPVSDSPGPTPTRSPGECFKAYKEIRGFPDTLRCFQELCDSGGVDPDGGDIYPALQAGIQTVEARGLWQCLDRRRSHSEYFNKSQERACLGKQVLIVGAGPCGLRMAIECAFLGASVTVIDMRPYITRNNVVHIWPFVIEDVKGIGGKVFHPKFCLGGINHVSIKRLQLMLLKITLLLGVKVYTPVKFQNILQPNKARGWHVSVSPADHCVNHMDFQFIIGASGLNNTLPDITKNTRRGRLAIAITANFVNRHTKADAIVQEIGGLSYIYGQPLMNDVKAKTGADLENLVYFKDDSHYFVMTVRKHSLLQTGVLKENIADAKLLLSKDNVDDASLKSLTRNVAMTATKGLLPRQEFALNHYGKEDIAIFDFTSISSCDYSCFVRENSGHTLVQCIVGDSLMQPFWPTGTGCGRGFHSVFDAAWMIGSWCVGEAPGGMDKESRLSVIAERENIFSLFTLTVPEKDAKVIEKYTIDPATRYSKINKDITPKRVRHLYVHEVSEPHSAEKRRKLAAKSSQDVSNDMNKKAKYAQESRTAKSSKDVSHDINKNADNAQESKTGMEDKTDISGDIKHTKENETSMVVKPPKLMENAVDEENNENNTMLDTLSKALTNDTSVNKQITEDCGDMDSVVEDNLQIKGAEIIDIKQRIEKYMHLTNTKELIAACDQNMDQNKDNTIQKPDGDGASKQPRPRPKRPKELIIKTLDSETMELVKSPKYDIKSMELSQSNVEDLVDTYNSLEVLDSDLEISDSEEEGNILNVKLLIEFYMEFIKSRQPKLALASHGVDSDGSSSPGGSGKHSSDTRSPVNETEDTISDSIDELLSTKSLNHENMLVGVSKYFEMDKKESDKTGSGRTGSDETGSDKTGSDEKESDETGSDKTGSQKTGSNEKGRDNEAPETEKENDPNMFNVKSRIEMYMNLVYTKQPAECLSDNPNVSSLNTNVGEIIQTRSNMKARIQLKKGIKPDLIIIERTPHTLVGKPNETPITSPHGPKFKRSKSMSYIDYMLAMESRVTGSVSYSGRDSSKDTGMYVSTYSLNLKPPGKKGVENSDKSTILKSTNKPSVTLHIESFRNLKNPKVSPERDIVSHTPKTEIIDNEKAGVQNVESPYLVNTEIPEGVDVILQENEDVVNHELGYVSTSGIEQNSEDSVNLVETDTTAVYNSEQETDTTAVYNSEQYTEYVYCRTCSPDNTNTAPAVFLIDQFDDSVSENV